MSKKLQCQRAVGCLQIPMPGRINKETSVKQSAEFGELGSSALQSIRYAFRFLKFLYQITQFFQGAWAQFQCMISTIDLQIQTSLLSDKTTLSTHLVIFPKSIIFFVRHEADYHEHEKRIFKHCLYHRQCFVSIL